MHYIENKFVSHVLLLTLLIAVCFSFLPTKILHAAEGEDHPVVFTFRLEVEGKLNGFFTSVSSIGSESEVVEQKVTNPDTGETIIQKIPGRLTWPDVTLSRGITANLDLWEWRRQVVDGNVDEARANCIIVAYNQANEEIARWSLKNAWPSRIQAPAIPGSPQDFLVEEITIVHEGMERVN